ncbi:MAG: formate dehydrogenase accessory protein FdhE [bacterium]|nr:MAG: formate dehydrogenase accessory protein FdhE [bacterium]
MSDNFVGLQQFYEMYLEFHERIFEIHVKCMQHLVAVLPFQKLNQINIATRLNQKKPILNKDNLIIAERELEHIFDLIFPTFKKHAYRSKEQILRLGELNDRRKFSLGKLVIAQIVGDNKKFTEISNKYDISVLLLEKLVEFVSSPYLELCAEFFNKKLAQINWEQPFCPICGSVPSMAKVNEKHSTRFLWCRFCDTTWSFPEMVCPFCLNDDLKSIRIIFLSDGRPVRIEACDNCKYYIKTIDELIVHQEYNFSVKYVETIYLDLLAKYCGYQMQDHIKFYLESI